MSRVKASVIIPTHNRQDKLAETLVCLAGQNLAATEYEIIIVDDGSNPPIVVSEPNAGPMLKLERVERLERSGARNRGAAIAKGAVLIFIDDDIRVERDFVASHLLALSEWPGALAVGSIRLPDESMAKPFVRFRQRLEQQNVPRTRGVTPSRNFCTAANMSISRDVFQKLGGFDRSIASSEDQDLALRHTGRGGQIVFLPEAKAVHCDDSLDIRSYCRRTEWGALHMVPFCQRYPQLPDNIERNRINGYVRLRREPMIDTVRKLVKLVLTIRVVLDTLFFAAGTLEKIAPKSQLLDRIYRLLLGAHILRGHRAGLKRCDFTEIANVSMTSSIATDHATR